MIFCIKKFRLVIQVEQIYTRDHLYMLWADKIKETMQNQYK
jgi:hypothetical protein